MVVLINLRVDVSLLGITSLQVKSYSSSVDERNKLYLRCDHIKDKNNSKNSKYFQKKNKHATWHAITKT